MKRKAHYWHDTGEYEFDPPVEETGLMGFKGWMPLDEYSALPYIEDEDLLQKYHAALRKVRELTEQIEDSLIYPKINK